MVNPSMPHARLLVAACAVTALSACGNNDNDDDNNTATTLQVATVSNRADLISGGDALLEVTLPAGASASKAISGLQVTDDGRDVSSAFSGTGNTMTGLIEGLSEGVNTVTVQADNAQAVVLNITNAPGGGPVVSGAQTVPYYCATATPQLSSGTTPATNTSGLSGEATDAQCSIPTEYKVYYKSTDPDCSLSLPDPSPSVSPTATNPIEPATPPANPCFKPYDASAATPTDMATISAPGGASVPYIVRVERGTMNRGIYDIAVLYNPAADWTATNPQAQWNGKVIYQLGASTGQPRRQARPQASWTNDVALQMGYLVVGNSMTDSARNSNRISMAETVMMMKEHIVERYGKIAFTIGVGCSGGSINANGNASIAPGNLDGITIFCTYPDAETTGIEVVDCSLLVEAYQSAAWTGRMSDAGYTAAEINAKKAAINGHPDQTGCHGWQNAFGGDGKAGNYNQRLVLDATGGTITTMPTVINNCELPASAVYDADTNPTGARCNGPSWSTSIWGPVQGTPYTQRTTDNTGVQYGLQALLDGAITAEEFVTLNEAIGGLGRDGDVVASRTQADTQALSIAYRSGIVSSGANLARLPIIDMRGWDDSGLITPPGADNPPQAPIHFVWRSFALRERIRQAYGDADNHVMWRFGRNGLLPAPSMQFEALLAMDAWLTAVKADTSGNPIEQVVRAARPTELAYDYCLLSTDETQSTRVTDAAQCDADPFLKPASSPRQVAGGPLAENVLKCQLKAIDVADYAPASFDADQLGRLQAVFDTGVCDWSKPGVGQQDAQAPLTFAAGPGGEPLPAAPVATTQ